MIKLATAISRRSPFHDLGSEATVQAFLFQQFLLFLTLIPATGAMTLASHSVIGEKQNRTLEPLLATPIATVELLTAKVLGALAPTLAVTVVAFGAYVGGIWWLAAPGVLRVLLSRRTMLIVFLLGPLAAMVALQIAVVVSSRVNDPRTAQQFGTLVILPLIGIMVAQFSGAFWLTTPLIVAVALVLFSVWLLLMVAGVVLFERENILTRWK
jgi:ABC-2 type transport system permease protein